MGEKRGKMTKKFLNPQKLPRTAFERLDLFSCLQVHDLWMAEQIQYNATQIPA